MGSVATVIDKGSSFLFAKMHCPRIVARKSVSRARWDQVTSDFLTSPETFWAPRRPLRGR